MKYFVYFLTNKNHSVLYIGVTNDIARRVTEHSFCEQNSFCARYNVNKLVYIEEYSSAIDAIEREKQIKGWNRKAKEKLINSVNPEWKDLFES